MASTARSHVAFTNQTGTRNARAIAVSAQVRASRYVMPESSTERVLPSSERYGSRSGECADNLGEDGEVRMKPDPLIATDLERQQRPLIALGLASADPPAS